MKRIYGITFICLFIGFVIGLNIGGKLAIKSNMLFSEKYVHDFADSLLVYGIQYQPFDSLTNSDIKLISYTLSISQDYNHMTLEQKVDHMNSVIEVAESHKILDPYLLYALAIIESGLDPSAVSPKGAKGVYQIMPKTAKLIARKYGVSWYDQKNSDLLFDTRINTHMSAIILMDLLDRYKRLDVALSVYNGLKPYPSSYSKKILSTREALIKRTELMIRRAVC